MKPMEETLQIIIRRSENLHENENREIEEVDRLAFTSHMDDLDWSSPEWFVIGKLAGRVVSIVGILKRRIRVDGTSLEVGGVGGVATHPEHQQRGYASALLQRVAVIMRADLKVDFGLLVCDQDMVSFYSKLGWQIAADEMVFDFHGTKRLFREKTMVLPLSERPWPHGRIDLCGAPW
jgi:ribosomal protein S18 acetylase RimI-like enzyme